MVPNPIITIGNTGIHLYGVFIGIGLICCLFVYFFYTSKKKMNKKVQDFGFYVAIGAIALGFVAAKLYQAIYNWIEKGFFDFYNAGITAMGGFIGGAAAFIILYFGVGHFLFKGKEKGIHIKEFNKMLLTAPICITVAHGFGRIGCLMAGCCHGAYLGSEYVFGGIWMTPPDTMTAGYYVPTQLYEALFLFALTAVLTLLYFKGSNLTSQIYLISYGVWRIIIELFRTDARGAVILGLAPSQWQSILFIVAGVGLIIFYYFKKIPFVLPKEQLVNEQNQQEIVEKSDVQQEHTSDTEEKDLDDEIK